MAPTSPICASCARDIWLTECLAVTCPISWPSTDASCASEFMYTRMPRVTKSGPPGRANAFTTGSSITVNDHGRLGRSDAFAIGMPIR